MRHPSIPFVAAAILSVLPPIVLAEPEAEVMATVPVNSQQAVDAGQESREKPERGVALEEIIVTAQRRVESLQDAPIAITAFGSDDLELRSISGIEDLRGNAPGLDVMPFPTASASALTLFIRGIGTYDVQVTQDPAVGVYLDGIYIARSSGLALDVADLERVEVLRGPQGTLYGRNTTGGAINLITKKPDPAAYYLKLSGSAGSRNLGASKGRSIFPLPILWLSRLGRSPRPLTDT